jgi:hypothetical protein
MEIASWLDEYRRLGGVLPDDRFRGRRGFVSEKEDLLVVLYFDQERKSGRMILPSKVVLRYCPVAQGDVHLLRVYFSRPSELEVLTPDQDEFPFLCNKADGRRRAYGEKVCSSA